MNLSQLSIQQRISAVAILVIFISAFLPWASVWDYTLLGVEGDGIITLVLAVAGAVVFLIGSDLLFPAKMNRKAADITLVVLSGLTVLISIFVTANIGSFASIGVYFTLIAGVGWAVCAIWHLMAMLNATKAQQAGPAPAPGESAAASAHQAGHAPGMPPHDPSVDRSSVPPQDGTQQPGGYRPPQPPGQNPAENG